MVKSLFMLKGRGGQSMLGKQKRVPTVHVPVDACELIKPSSVSMLPMLKPAAFANPAALSHRHSDSRTD